MNPYFILRAAIPRHCKPKPKNTYISYKLLCEPIKLIARILYFFVPGNLGFDPLGLTPKDPKEFDLLRTKEINNGRLAMIGIAGIVAQELVTSEKVFNF